MNNELRLIHKGSQVSLAAVVEQGSYHERLAEDHAVDLIANGWTAAETVELSGDLAQLQSEDAVHAEAAGSAHSATRIQDAKLADAKRLVRMIRNVLPRLFRNHALVDVSIHDFEAGQTLGRSVPSMETYLNHIELPAAKLDALLAPYLQGKTASEEIRRVRKALHVADIDQEVELAGLPERTRNLYALKGRVLDLIEEMNAVARNAYDGNAALIGQFNKDILLRSRHAAAAAAVAEAI